MNGLIKYALTLHVSEEREAFAARSYTLMMQKPMNQRIHDGNITKEKIYECILYPR